MSYWRVEITQVGPDVADLLEGGVLILFDQGVPSELAEVAVLHHASAAPSLAPPPVGGRVMIGESAYAITAVGDTAWAKVQELGHVVLNFSGADKSERPGDICLERADAAQIAEALQPKTVIEFTD